MHEELARICEKDQADRKGDLPFNQPLIYAWKEQDVPQLEAIELESQPAILIRSPVASAIQLFTRLGDVYYLIVGQIALDDLLRIATSIF